jgi:hypothetical protein
MADAPGLPRLDRVIVDRKEARMSATTLAHAEAPPARSAQLVPSRLTLLFAVILTTSVAAFALSVVSYVREPAGADGLLPGYAEIAPMRGYLWAFFVVAGVQLVVGACAAAVAGWLLAPARGARWSTVGGSVIWLGAAIYGVGIGGWATAYYFATDRSTLGARSASALVHRINHDTAHMLAVPVTGAVLIAVGSLALSVGLWRARTVPKWVVLVGALSSVATLALEPSTAAGLVAEAASSITTIAIGWYAWQLRGASSRLH